MLNTFNGQLTSKVDGYCYICGTGIQKMYSPLGLCNQCQGGAEDVKRDSHQAESPRQIQKVVSKPGIKRKRRNKSRKKKQINSSETNGSVCSQCEEVQTLTKEKEIKVKF